MVFISVLLFANTPHIAHKTVAQIHTDRFCYVSGDKLFVKIYYFTEPNTSNTAEIAMYVDMVDADNHFVCGEILKLDNGVASGLMSIPDTLKTGEYLLRSYTQSSKKENCILQTKLLFVTNRFGANSQSRISNKPSIITANNSLPTPTTSEFVQLKLQPNDSVFKKRSKVVVSFKLLNKNHNNGLSASLSVKPISVCEANYSGINKTAIYKSSFIDTDCADSITLKSLFNEGKGFVVSGRVIHKITKNPLENILILLAYKDSSINIKYAISDKNGYFEFLLNSFFGNKIIYATTYSYPKMAAYPDAQIVLNSKFIVEKQKPALADKKTSFMESADSLNVKKAVVAKAYALAYHKNIEQANYNITFEQKYLMGGNVKTTYTSDYISLPNFYEIAREILPFVKVRKKGVKYVFYVNDGINNKIRANPLVMVDGIPITNFNELMGWGTDKIKSVQVQIQPRYYGDVAFENGIILIWTKHCDFWTTQQVKGSNAYVMQGFQQPVEFYFPQYNTKQFSKTPDFRSVLYWEPNIKINGNGIKQTIFYTSDETGFFEITLRGFTKNNKPVFIRKYIYVSK